MDFVEWIAHFKDVDLPIGDMANDVLRDKFFPKSNNYGEIHAYIKYKSSESKAVLSVFEAVWNFYLSST